MNESNTIIEKYAIRSYNKKRKRKIFVFIYLLKYNIKRIKNFQY